jgi:hypothetical protein
MGSGKAPASHRRSGGVKVNSTDMNKNRWK